MKCTGATHDGGSVLKICASSSGLRSRLVAREYLECTCRSPRKSIATLCPAANQECAMMPSHWHRSSARRGHPQAISGNAPLHLDDMALLDNGRLGDAARLWPISESISGGCGIDTGRLP